MMHRAVGLVVVWAGLAWAQASQPVVDWANIGVLSSPVTVDTSADALPASPLSGRRRVVVYNNDNAATMYLGACSGTTVTTANGLPLPARAAVVMELGPSATICGIVGSGSIDVRVLELK